MIPIRNAYPVEKEISERHFYIVPAIDEIPIEKPVKDPDLYFSLDAIIYEVERRCMEWAMDITKGNKARAARILGLKRTTFVEKFKAMKDLDDTAA